MRNRAQCDLLVYFSTALTYLFSNVTKLNIDTGGGGRRQGEWKKNYQSTFCLGSVWIKSTFSRKEKGRRRTETSREQDKGIKERSIISRDTDRAEEERQTENGGPLGVTYCWFAAHSTCFQLFSPALSPLRLSKHQPAADRLWSTRQCVSISGRECWIQQMEAVLYVFTAPSTAVGSSKCPPRAVSSCSLLEALILLLC